jgi:uncharacterized protein (DUF58 family)
MPKFDFEFKPTISHLDMATRSVVSNAFVGNYKSVFRGRGVEFEGFRSYMPDDDAGLIDWKASARIDTPLVREYIEERNLTLFFMLDCSTTMVYGSHDKLKNEYAAELVSALSFTMLKAGDMAGLSMFGDGILESVPAFMGMAQYYKIRKTLVNVENYGGKCAFSKSLSLLPGVLKDRSMLMLISDFLGVDEGWEKKLGILGKRYDLMGIMVHDPLDDELPKGVGHVMVYKPGDKGEQLLVNPDAVGPDYARVAAEQREKVRQAFKKAGAELVEMRTDKPFNEPILELFERRRALMR